eukprot:3562254-Prymnesium_polylepis.1
MHDAVTDDTSVASSVNCSRSVHLPCPLHGAASRRRVLPRGDPFVCGVSSRKCRVRSKKFFYSCMLGHIEPIMHLDTWNLLLSKTKICDRPRERRFDNIVTASRRP